MRPQRGDSRMRRRALGLRIISLSVDKCDKVQRFAVGPFLKKSDFVIFRIALVKTTILVNEHRTSPGRRSAVKSFGSSYGSELKAEIGGGRSGTLFPLGSVALRTMRSPTL